MSPYFVTSEPNRSSGFTLLELVVAMAIFSLFLLVFVGAFSRFVQAQRRDSGEQVIQEELRFALELFNREARTGYASTYALTDASGQSVTFRNQNQLCVNYRLNIVNGIGRLERAEISILGLDCDDPSLVYPHYAPLTSSAVAIDLLRFDPVAAADGDGDGQLDEQGLITIIVQARAAHKPTPPLLLQSTITSRQVVPFATNL